MPENDDKTLIHSAEFDPSNFVRGIDLMTAAMEKLSQQEAAIQVELKKIDASLKTNRQEYRVTTDQIKTLDKSSLTYKDDLAKLTAQKKLLTSQQKELAAAMKVQKDSLTQVNNAANSYKTSVQNIVTVTKNAAKESRGQSFFDVVNLQSQVNEVVQAGGRLRNVFQGKINTAELDKFEKSLSETSDEFQQLRQIIDFVKPKLETLDPNSQAFEDLNRVIATGEVVLEAYGSSMDNVNKKSVSLRSQIAELRNQMAVLEQQGKENTKEFQDLAIQAGRLQDQMEDTQARIKVLASDTKNIDFGIGAIRGVASAFGVAEGAAALFGLKSEDVAKSLQRLNAIMLILQGLQEIQNLLQKQSIVAIVGQEIATKAGAVAQRVYAVAVGTSTGAMKAFRVALLATGIGAFIALVGLAANAMDLFGKKTKLSKEELEDFNLSLSQSNRALSNAAKDVQFRNQLAIEAAKQRGATEAEISNLIVEGYREEANVNRETAKQKVKDVTDAVARFTKGAVIIDPESVNTLKDARDALVKVEQAELRIARLPGVTDTVTEGLQTAVEATKDIVATFEAATDADRNATEEIARFQTKRFDDARKSAEKNAEGFKAFLEKLQALERELRDKTLAAQPQDEAIIRESFSNQIADLTADIDKDPRLTKKQGTILKNLLGKINKVDLDAALKEFNEQVEAAQKELNKKQFDLQIQNSLERAELIRDQFVSEAELIKTEAQKQAKDLIDERDELIKNIRDTPGILPDVKAENIEKIQLIYEQLLENLATQTTRKQEEISARVFAAMQEETRNIFANVQLLVSETATAEIVAAAEAFEQGRINYEEYQKELTRIARVETDRRIATALREADALLKAAQTKLLTEKDPERIKQLNAEILQLRQQIADLQRQLAIAAGEGAKGEADEFDLRIQRVAAYAVAINGIIQQVIGFWQQVNEAEQEALQRSINLQETRVQAAQKIAERGNAEYLRLEEERLQELQLKQENAARRQLAINAVLQTSQALTAFVSALAQGIATTGPLGGIAIAAAVIAAIASGYAIVQSLQPQTQTLKGGTKEVRRGREDRPGVDTVPAMLTEGESVLPVNITKEYRPTIEALFDRKIPSSVINNFVNKYNGVTKNYPQVNHERMSQAAEVHITYGGELLAATREQNRLLSENATNISRVERAISRLGVSVNLDKDGLAISLMKAVDQFKIDKRV